ncbi:hypothetical protein KKG48_01520 [Patescibacteria group bacterium]|nr:hypothetical protein [Patescibacteria group bacterium]MCG2694483.1 GDSL-type esterase/lipase family protein [Candidatus Parcubacteria bacterium]
MKNISVFGDSLVYGTDDDGKKGGWVIRLQNKAGEKNRFWNFGICGDTSTNLLKRIEKNCEEKNPDIAMVFIGANDSQYKTEKENTLVNIEDYKNNLEEILKILNKYTQKIIFIGLPKMNDGITTNWNYKYYFCNENLKKYDDEIKKFCEKNNLKYIHIFDVLNENDLSDGAHPNSIGYEKIADKIYKSVVF